MKTRNMNKVLVLALTWSGVASAQNWSFTQQQLSACGGDTTCASCIALLMAQPGAYPTQEACELASGGRLVNPTTSMSAASGPAQCQCTVFSEVAGAAWIPTVIRRSVPANQPCTSLEADYPGAPVVCQEI